MAEVHSPLQRQRADQVELRRFDLLCRRPWCDHPQDGADGDRLTLGRDDLSELPRRGRGNLDIDLVGGDLDERLALVDSVADSLEPSGNDPFRYELTHRREGQRNRVSHS